MPIDLEEFEKLTKQRKTPQIVPWDKVILKILDSGLYWSVNEVHNDLVHQAVTRFRVKTVLDDAYKAGKLDRGYDGKRFYYGKKRRKRRRKKDATKA